MGQQDHLEFSQAIARLYERPWGHLAIQWDLQQPHA